MTNSERALARLHRAISPMHELIPLHEYVRLRRFPSLTRGRTRLFQKEFEFNDAAGYLHSIQEVMIDGLYHLKANERARPLIVDAGANMGLSTLYFKRLIPDARVIAFEPDPVIFDCLVENVRTYGLQNVEAKRAAVWTSNAELQFHSEGSLGGSASNGTCLSTTTFKVPALRLLDFLDEPVELLKIDVEGAERALIPDIAPALVNVSKLFFEYHAPASGPDDLDDLLRIVRGAGFRYVLNGAYAPTKPFTEQWEGTYPFQINVFCSR